MKKLDIIDPTGAKLSPGVPQECQGNGEHEGFEICCDECDYFLLCFGGEKNGKTN